MRAESLSLSQCIRQHLGQVLATRNSEWPLTPSHLPMNLRPGCWYGLKEASYSDQLWLQFQANCLVVLVLQRQEAGIQAARPQDWGGPSTHSTLPVQLRLSSGPHTPSTWAKITHIFSCSTPLMSDSCRFSRQPSPWGAGGAEGWWEHFKITQGSHLSIFSGALTLEVGRRLEF